jgi:O-acetylhomoserine (thiol)-lyase
MSTVKKGFNTRLLHISYSKKDAHGSLLFPIYSNSAFEFESSEDIAGAFCGSKPAHAYSRSSNPTVEHLEMRVKSITESLGVIACASGMAAVTNVILNLCNAGDNLITSKKLFGNTYALFESTLKGFDIKVNYADFTNPSSIIPLIDNNTRLLYFETINNPHLEVINIQSIAEIAKKHKLVLCSDTTLTPPNILDAGKAGIDISVLSSTKYISTGGASIGGIIIDHGSFNWQHIPKLSTYYQSLGNLNFITRLRKEMLRNTGGCMSPFNAYLQALGLETMVLRFDKMASNTLQIATWLQNNKNIKAVNYPGLENNQYYNLCKEQFTGLPGSILTFDLESKNDCFKFLNNLKLVKRATNLNDNKTLIIHPASTIYCEFSAEVLEQLEIRDTMIRLSVGIEDVEDVINDFKQALS